MERRRDAAHPARRLAGEGMSGAGRYMRPASGLRYCSPLRMQQLLEVVHEHVRALAVTDIEPQFSLRIEDERSCRMIHRIGPRRRARLLLVDDLEFLRSARRRLGVAVESYKPRIERRHV